MVTEGRIEEILCIFSVSYSQINLQLPFKEADISPVAVCPKCFEGDWGRGVGNRMGKLCKLEKRLKILPYNTENESQDR